MLHFHSAESQCDCEQLTRIAGFLLLFILSDCYLIWYMLDLEVSSGNPFLANNGFGKGYVKPKEYIKRIDLATGKVVTHLKTEADYEIYRTHRSLMNSNPNKPVHGIVHVP